MLQLLVSSVDGCVADAVESRHDIKAAGGGMLRMACTDTNNTSCRTSRAEMMHVPRV